MTAYVAVVVTLILVATAVGIARKELANRRIVGYLRRAEDREAQMWDVLQLVKDYRESGRVHHKDAEAVKADTQKTVAVLGETVAAKADELAHKIEEVPVKVVEVIKAGGDGPVPRQPKRE